MPNNPISGVQGLISLPQASDLTTAAGANALLVITFGAQITRDEWDITPLDPDSTYEQMTNSIMGLAEMDGSATGSLAADVAHDPSWILNQTATSDFKLQFNAGHFMTFAGYITSWVPAVQINSPNAFNVTFKASGPVVFSQPS